MSHDTDKEAEGNQKCIRDMPAPVSGAYVSRCLLAVRSQVTHDSFFGSLIAVSACGSHSA